MKRKKLRRAIAVTVWGESFLVKHILYHDSVGIICAQITDSNDSDGMMLSGRDIILLAKIKTK